MKQKGKLNTIRKENEVVTFDESLTKPCRKVTVEEGEKIATELFRVLNERGDGIGLSANQMGIDAAVAVVNVREPMVLVNPKIVEAWDEVSYQEGCLSYPGEQYRTKRFKYCIVETDITDTKWYFGPQGAEFFAKFKEKDNATIHGPEGDFQIRDAKEFDALCLLESVCIQHEIDHLNGVTIRDRESRLEPIRAGRKFGRNEKVEITNGKETKLIKWKKAEPLITIGEWKLV
jgi:peptide deformylase